MDDCFQQFFDHFERGDAISAIAVIVPTPEVAYESLSSKEPLFPLSVNYIDAAVFGTIEEAKFSNHCLLNLLERCNFIARYPKTCTLLKLEQEMMHATLTNNLVNTDTMELLLPDPYRKCMEKKSALKQGWRIFKEKKPEYAALCEKSSRSFSLPWYPLSYSLPIEKVSISSDATPLVFLEPLNGDLKSILSPLNGKPAIFVFETCATFLQLLQFPEAVETLCDPHHLLFILNMYPHEQFAIQQKPVFHENDLQPVMLTPRKHISAVLPLLIQALKACLEQSAEAFKKDTEMGNWLYHISKRLLLCIQQERLGINRTPALLELQAQKKWHDPHKGTAPSGYQLGPEPKNTMEIKISQLAKQRISPSRKIRLAHVVPQIVDGGHAPSCLLENLVHYHDPKRFELAVISTERMQFHLFEYPYNIVSSPSSSGRAPHRLNYFRSLGVKVEVMENEPTYEKSALDVAKLLKQWNIDVVVFHGPDSINDMCANCCEVPLRVLFEHGTQPDYPGYDVVIVSSSAAAEIYRELFCRLKTEVHVLPFAVDVRQGWSAQPYPKSILGIPEDSLIMTTISHNLDSRLSHEMCTAIVEILQRVPKAYYAPMGKINDLERFNQFFQDSGVKERVIFLGPMINPSQYARSMHLYLNEFPFGSGLGILDAMAAGCPVVTMYDRQGPQQARYGGEYFGIDRVVASGKPSDYVELACQLLTDSKMYSEWSEHAKKQYDNHTDVQGHTKAFEEIVSGAIKTES